MKYILYQQLLRIIETITIQENEILTFCSKEPIQMNWKVNKKLDYELKEKKAYSQNLCRWWLFYHHRNQLAATSPRHVSQTLLSSFLRRKNSRQVFQLRPDSQRRACNSHLPTHHMITKERMRSTHVNNAARSESNTTLTSWSIPSPQYSPHD